MLLRLNGSPDDHRRARFFVVSATDTRRSITVIVDSDTRLDRAEEKALASKFRGCAYAVVDIDPIR